MGVDPFGGRRVEDRPGTDIEDAAVQGAFQCPLAPVRVQLALPKPSASMWALVIDGVKGAVDIHQCDLKTLDLDEFDGADRKLVRLGDFD
jgi:hypothetical protein